MENILKIFPEITCFGNLEDNSSGNISKSDFEKSELFFNCSKIKFDDTISGNYKNVDFKAAETCIEDDTDSKNRLQVFKGVALMCTSGKNISGKTTLTTKNAQVKNNHIKNCFKKILSNSFFIRLTAGALVLINITGFNLYRTLICLILLFFAIICFIIFSKYFAVNSGAIKSANTVILEDTKFNKRFNVYSSNQVEARYLLTPAFMERFYNLKTAFSAKSIRCSFFEDKLMVAIETKKDLFELGDLFTSIKDPTNIFQFYRELTSIFNIIDALKLEKD